MRELELSEEYTARGFLEYTAMFGEYIGIGDRFCREALSKSMNIKTNEIPPVQLEASVFNLMRREYGISIH